MNTPDHAHDPAEPSRIGDDNLARLVGEAYHLELADSAFVRQVEQKLFQVAGELAEARVPIRTPRQERLSRLRWRLTFAMTAAATVAGIALFMHARSRSPGERPELAVAPEPAEAARLSRLTPRPRPQAPALTPVQVGERLETLPGQRRRVGLPDGSVAYLNEKTQAHLDADRKLTVQSGEVFLEVAPRQAGAADALFVVQTPTRTVHALGTKFAVKAEPPGTQVVVTQGKVLCCPLPGDEGQLVVSGQQLTPAAQAADTVAPAPRASHVLDWTRDLMIAAESPLVPASQYGGGALLAVDPNGQQAKLSLRKYHIDVHIEDGFARTTIDQTYFNDNSWRMEGTFYFPLPPDASLSRLAMYVANDKDAILMEGGMADRDHARTTFETIVSKQKDPALLEWVDGSTFKMRVFPLEGRQEKRIILSYTQRLPSLYSRTQYRFPAGHNLEGVREWAFHARIKGGADLDIGSGSHPFAVVKKDGDMLLDASERNARINKDVQFALFDRRLPVDDEPILFSSAEHEQARYTMLRYRPALRTPHSALRTRRDWVFLFESDAARDPLLARAQVDILNNLMIHAEPDDRFVLLTAGAQTQAFDALPRPMTATNVQAAIAFLERTHLVGALNLEQALAAARPHLQGNACLVHLGSGVPVLGERREDVLVKQLAENVPYVGVGVGKRWARSFMKAAAERTGGHFTQINPDEPIAWRSFELLATLNTPRLLNLQIVDNDEKAVFLPYAASVAQGEELCAIARLPRGGTLPRSLTIHGTLAGESFTRVVPVAQVAAKADYLPRTWAKLEIDRLLAEDSQKNKPAIIELSKAMYVMTPFTSLLVLENDAMYTQYNVDRGRKDHWALYACPSKIPVVYEPEPWMARNTGAAAAKPKADEVVQTVMVRSSPSVIAWPQLARPGMGHVIAGLHFKGAYAETGSDRTIRVWDADPNTPFLELEGLGLNYDYYFSRLGEVSVPGPIPTRVQAINEFGWVNYYRNHGYQVHAFAMLAPPGFGGGLDGGIVGNWYTDGFSFATSLQPTGHKMLLSYGGGLANGLTPPGQRYLMTMLQVEKDTSERIREEAYQTFLISKKLGNPGIPNEELRRAEMLYRRLAPEPKPSEGILRRPINARLSGNFTSDVDLPLPVIKAARIANGSGLFDIPLVVDPYLSYDAIGTPAITSDLFRLTDLQNTVLPSHYPAIAKSQAGNLVYRRPQFSGNDRIFTDLLAYAPGMNTSMADLLAAVDAEAVPDNAETPGTIDPAASALIDKARQIGWQTRTFDEVTVTFNGLGHYRLERTTADGLRERIVCDGTTLCHLYPDLGVGARRTVTRFHRAELAQWLPEVLPPAEDLARGCDLQVVGERTIALVPRAADAKGHVRWHLYFDTDGRLVERRLVQAPKEKTLLRVLIHGAIVEIRNGDDHRVAQSGETLTEARPADLKPELQDLVVLPLPYRTVNHVTQTRKLTNSLSKLPDDAESLHALLAVAVAYDDTELATRIYHQLSDFGRRPQPLGLFTILAACGCNVDALPQGPDLRNQYPREPLARYLAIHANPNTAKHCDLWEVPTGDTLLQRLTAFRALYHRWKKGDVYSFADAAQRQREREQALAFVHRNPTALGWALLDQVEERLGSDAAGQRAIAPSWLEFTDMPSLAYAARYENARSLARGDQKEQARKRFEELYTQTLAGGQLPLLGTGFQLAVQGEAWDRLVLDAARKLTADKHRQAAVLLAWQCRSLDAAATADAVLDIALEGITPKELPATLAAVEYLWQTGTLERVEALVQGLLTDPTIAREPSLWRLAALVAHQRQQPERMVAALEKALDLEFHNLPEVINLEPVRADYRSMLDFYAQTAGNLPRTDGKARRDLAAKVVQAADRWRSLDNDATVPSRTAARILAQLGEGSLSWEYLTSPLAQHPGDDAAARVNLNEILPGYSGAGTFDLRASDAPNRWKQAASLIRAGRPEEAAATLQNNAR